MVSLCNYYQKKNLKFTALLKKFTFIFLIWTYNTYIYMDIFSKTLDNKSEHGKILYREIRRLLGKHDINRKLGYAGTGTKLLHDNIGKSKKNVEDASSISSQLNKKGSNNLDSYMKNYKRRYEKKKGLYKLDCYCEKKLFDKINYIEKLSDKMKSDKRGFKKKVSKKYGIGFIILSLIPTLGLIYYILFGVRLSGGAIALCWDKEHYNGSSHNDTTCNGLYKENWSTTLRNIWISNVIFTYTMIIIVLLFLFYFLTKIVKYEKLKAGKGKMNRKEYICFCKEIFNIN
ncbi:hypothetical protein PVMG_05603 [Plasmodium vivax Mauritania I]|uniref:Variable surface protein Vir35 n=1 Tax=Plasmodium vivax Mauritania I TaxID=1035515 RepID=A0A0J9TJ14_PLAVI|nr:hypothetical protein PVMG_05603 [Plasmodium vivax Mauritania I]